MNYVSLEKIRFHDTLITTFDRSILTSPLELPPMLLLPLVENAFKHGAVINDVLEVRVHCAYKDQRLCFRVTNTVQSKITKNKSGLGLSILEKRLALLYPRRHSLKGTHIGDYYRAELIIIDPQTLTHEEV